MAKSGGSTFAGTLAAASFVAVTQIVTIDVLDGWLLASICIFAISLPLLSMAWFQEPFPSDVKIHDPEFDRFAVFMAIVLFDLSGFTLVFFHFRIWVGCLFLVSCYFALRFSFPKASSLIVLKGLWAFFSHPAHLLYRKIRPRRD